MNKILLLIIGILSLMSSIAHSEDIKLMYGNTPGWCVTDDSNLTPMMNRCDTSGYLKTTLATALSYSTDSVTVYPPDPTYSHISTNTSTQVKSGTGYLFGISINKAGASSNIATLYDNTSCATTVIAVIDTTIAGNVDYHGLKFTTGLCIVTATGTAGDLTVVIK